MNAPRPEKRSSHTINAARGGVYPRRATTAAFTLIELLIVVAIIAILAAIAVPNFLEAQTRSKVSRTKADLRSLATAVESYRVDNNKYYKASFYQNLAQRITPYTTPIAYISSVPIDPCYQFSSTNFAGTDGWYCYTSGNLSVAGDDLIHSEWAGSLYTLAGRGPDLHYNFGGICTARPDLVSTNAYERGSYDATNGSTSEGDIIRLGSGTLGGAS